MESQKDKIGTALLEAIEAGVVSEITPVDRRDHHFRVDHGAHVVLRTPQNDSSPWRFSFSASHVQTLAELHTQSGFFDGPYIWLLCEDNRCELRPSEWDHVLHTDAPNTTQTIRIERPPRHSFRVWGPEGALSHRIPVKRFPSLEGRA